MTSSKNSFKDFLLYPISIWTQIIKDKPEEFISMILSGEPPKSFEVKEEDSQKTFDVTTEGSQFTAYLTYFESHDDESCSVKVKSEDDHEFSLNLSKFESKSKIPWKGTFEAEWLINPEKADEPFEPASSLRRRLLDFGRRCVALQPNVIVKTLSVELKTSAKRMWTIVSDPRNISWVQGAVSIEMDETDGQLARVLVFEENESQDPRLWERFVYVNDEETILCYEYGESDRYPSTQYYMGRVTVEALPPSPLSANRCQMSYELSMLTSLPVEVVQSAIDATFHDRPQWFKEIFDEAETEESECRRCALA